MDRKERNVATGELYRARVLSTRKTWLPTAGVPCVANLTNQHPSLKFHRLLRFHHEPWILDLGDRFEKLVGSQAYKKVLFSRVGAIEKAFMQAGQGAFASSLPKRGKCSGFYSLSPPKRCDCSHSHWFSSASLLYDCPPRNAHECCVLSIQAYNPISLTNNHTHTPRFCIYYNKR